MEEEVLDQVEVEDRFEELDVISDGVDDLNLQRAIGSFSNLREVDLGHGNSIKVQPRLCVRTYRVQLKNFVLCDGLGLLENLVGDVLGSGTTVRHVIFDTKVIVWSTRVVRSGQEDTTISLVLPDNIRRGGG